MEITRKDKGNLQATLVVKIQENDYLEAVNEELKKLRKQTNIKGFRPGHVPMNVVQRMFGDKVKVEEVNKVIDKQIKEYLKENKLDLIGELLPTDEESKIDFEKDKDFEFSFDAGFYPEINIDIESLDVKKYIITATDELIEKEIDNIKRKHGEMVEKEEVEDQEGVSIYIDAKEKKEDGIKITDSMILVSTLSDEAKEKIIGAKVNDKLELNLKKAISNQADLSALLKVEKDKLQEISDNFEIEIKKIDKFEPAKFDEEIIEKEFGEKLTVEQAKEKIKEKLQKELEEEAKLMFKLDLQDKIVEEAMKSEMPEEFIIRWQKNIYKDKTEEEIKKGLESLIKSLLYVKILTNYSENKKINVEREDLVEESKINIINSLNQYGLPTSYFTEEQLNEFANQEIEKMDSNSINSLFFTAMENKTANHIYTTKEEAEQITFDDYKKIVEDRNKKIKKENEEKVEETKEQVSTETTTDSE